MIGYPFIEAFFKSVLSKSKAIDGRFFLLPNMGQELSTDSLGKLIKDQVYPQLQDRKLPLAAMLPPVSYGHYSDKQAEWESNVGIIFFLTQAYVNGARQIKNVNPNTRTSTHTIIEDWHDMKRCATNFIRVVRKVQVERGLINDRFRLDQSIMQVQVTPVSGIGADNLAGVKLEFGFSLFSGCEYEDYDQDDIPGIEIPQNDPHPEHNL